MIRYLTPFPAVYSLAQLTDQAQSLFPDLVDLNEVDVDGIPNVAIYLPLDEGSPEPAEVATWRSDVAKHVPVHPTPEELDAQASAAAADAPASLEGAQAKNRTFLALASPTTAQRNAQVAALTIQMQGILASLGLG